VPLVPRKGPTARCQVVQDSDNGGRWVVERAVAAQMLAISITWPFSMDRTWWIRCRLHTKPLPDEHAFGPAPEVFGFVDMIQTKHFITILDEIDNDVVILEISGFRVQSPGDQSKLDLL